MADSRRHLSTQQLDLEQILQEAQNRWLRPSEICEILRNYQTFHLTPDPPVTPPAGSLFLFDRKALRYFRKDGHRWRKKKDGKTVREAHEKLKAGSVDVLHCYYAHGEDNENFQRRSYWMLDGQLEHIVLVHYREVKEGYKSGASRLLNADPLTHSRNAQVNSALCLANANSPALPVQTSYVSSPNTGDWTGQTRSSEFDDGDSGDDPGICSLNQPIHGSTSHNTSLHAHDSVGFFSLSTNPLGSAFAGANFSHGISSPLWAQVHSSNKSVQNPFDRKFYVEQPGGAESISRKLVDARLDADCRVQDDVTTGIRLIPTDDIQAASISSQRADLVSKEHDLHLEFQSHSDCHHAVASVSHIESSHQGGCTNNDASGELKKLDSFGRWMDKEIGVDCDDSLMASDSGNYWNTLDTQNDDKEVSSLSRQMQLDVDSFPSLSQEQLFSICDFSPDWAYSGVETKVLITGTFLGKTKYSIGTKWCCMFGEIEVPAEVLINNVIRCRAPSHAPGRVPFYVTCSNRLACSEVREFEYRENLSRVAFSVAVEITPEDELRFQIRLAKLLSLDLKRKWLDCSNEECDKCKLKKQIFAIKGDNENDWKKIEADSIAFEGNNLNPKDVLIQNLLKDRLCEWLICKVHEVDKGPNIWDEKGQGVIHLAAALGYDWAMDPIVACGVSPNFRDTRGRTGLHWASFFGREETVLALVRLGAAPGAVDDPTPSFPGGQTAADLASSRGHKGIAGYLAEAYLVSHLSSLTINQCVRDSVAMNIAEGNATETAEHIFGPSEGAIDGQLSLKGSLAAVRKSTHAAALIQAAFRARSFRHRQLTRSSNDISEVLVDLVALGSLNKVQKKTNFNDYLHSAAVKIQQKYRGWKGRKEFLKIRNRIVRIQAHVRGHQVRKQYKKVVWSVGIVEKAILRWRRKGSGLRGFRVENAIGNVEPGTEKADEYEFLRIGRKQKYAGVENALARVKSMARHPEARDQYMRLVTNFGNLKVSSGGSGAPKQAEGAEGT
ncbi:calmodulin-binding transcription activator 3-like isoform X2 [Malania oleifera]|uniref:calmodulin-binding transcription activator 3-like isoform X2 n=1 Tax=Malania oleifera TaxID=397392 RepID=UPI0025ADF508|nr:calmodulin-binding transcription activator 3-like isoform X2 [Malania oleifera]